MEILIHTSASLIRVTAACLLSLPIALLLGVFVAVCRQIDAVLKIILPIPKLIFLPLIMLCFGIGEASKTIFLMLFTVFPLSDAFKTAFLSTDKDTVFMYKKAGMTSFASFCEITFPQSLPLILTALGSSAAQSFAVLILAEGYGTNKGLGFFILDSFFKVHYLKMLAAILLSSGLGFLFPLLSRILVKKLCKWYK